jgi:hypothetical protein
MEIPRVAWPDIIIILLSAVTLNLLYILVLILIRSIRARNKPIQKPFIPQKFLTLRISNIPRNVTAKDLQDILTKLPITAQAIDTQPVLLGYSYSPTAVSSFAARYAVATVTFEHAPATSELEMVLKQKIGIEANQLKVDLDFLGITPLFDGGEGITVE